MFSFFCILKIDTEITSFRNTHYRKRNVTTTFQPRLLHQRQFDADSVVSALSLHSNLTHVAIGFANGKVLLLKGDITKEKYSKVVQLHSSSYPVTCLNWSKSLLFVTTTKDAQYYDVSARQPGRRHIDEKGCAPNCATVTESGELVLGQKG